MTELAMTSLITETLSMDDRALVRDTMRPPLTWLMVWNVRALQGWQNDEAMVRAFADELTAVS